MVHAGNVNAFPFGPNYSKGKLPCCQLLQLTWSLVIGSRLIRVLIRPGLAGTPYLETNSPFSLADQSQAPDR